MAVNSAGYVPLFDAGAPKVVSGRARETIVPGEFLFSSGANNVVSSGANSFDGSTDLLFATGGSGAQFNGLAMAAAGSNESISVATGVSANVTANGTVTAGFPISCDGNHSVANAGSVAGNLSHQRVIGRALTSAASGGHALVQFY